LRASIWRLPRLAFALAWLEPSQAQVVQEPAAAATSFERVVVTGTHIRQTDAEGPLPVQVITREEIERSGVTTVEQLLERVPANINGINAAQTIGDISQPGLAAANLRGLGSGSTLVLLNGRRLANYAFNGETVDLNTIPFAAIERVEVLKDGASAIYGTDAIAGVVNFILRKDYRGADIAGSIDVTQHGGGNAGQVSVALGTGEPARDGYNLFAVASYQNQQALAGADREATRSQNRPDLGINLLSSLTFPSNVFDRPGGRVLNPAVASGCAPPSSLPNPTRPPARPGIVCGFDPAAVADVLPEVERMSAFARGTWRASPTLDVFAEALFARNEFVSSIAPYPQPQISTFGTLTYPTSGPYYPTDFAAANGLSGPLLFSWRAIELGPRVSKATTDAQRYLLGLEGEAAGWDYNAAAVYSANQQEVEYGGSYMYQSRLVAALRSGLVNPWGPSGPEGLALLSTALYSGTPQTADASTSMINAFASRTIADLPAGPLALAVGAEARRERLSYDWDPAVLTGDSPIGERLKSTSGSRNVLALFAELNVPIVRTLDAQFAVRWDDYSDFGSTTNPKAALRWQPLQNLLFRASWGEGFRAPPLYTLTEPTSDAGIATVPDPVRCPVTGTIEDCVAVVSFTSGGNPDLKPETSTQWNAGFVWEPLRELSLGADYWHINQQGVIGAPNAFESASYLLYPDRVVRGPVDPAYPALPGPMIGFDGSYLNLGATKTSGIDLTVGWTLPPTDFGNWRLGLQGTYVLEFETQVDGLATVSRLGTAVYGAPIPRWRSALTVDWTRGSWGATLAWLYSSGYWESITQPAPGQRKVDAISLWDLQLRYAGFAGWQLAGGIRNLFDDDPPFSQTSAFQFGFNPQVASPLGRAFYVRAGYSFR
jgi:iron complex outermembrane receptor protein